MARVQMVVSKLEEVMEGQPELVVTALEALSNMPLADDQQVPCRTRLAIEGYEPFDLGLCSVSNTTLQQLIERAALCIIQLALQVLMLSKDE